MADTTRTLSVKWVGDASSLEKSADQAERKVSGFGKTMGSVGTIAAGAFTGQALMSGAQQAVDFLQQSVTAAQEDERAQAALAKTLKNTTGATKDQVAQVSKWIDKTQLQYGVVDDKLRPALGTLLRATGDVGQAQGIMANAMDIAAGSGKDVETVSTALAKAYQGNYGALGKMGIKIDEARAKSEGFGYVQDEINKKFGGQAAAAANTSSGKMERLKIQWAEMQETIGYKLLPVITKLADFLMNELPQAIDVVVKWVQTNWPKIQQYIGPAIKFVMQYVENMIQVFRGVIEVLQGLIDFIVGVFTGDWSRAWEGIKEILHGFFNIFSGLFQNFFDQAMMIVQYAWKAIQGLWDAALDAIVGLITVYINIWKGLITGFINFAKTIFTGAWDGLTNGLSAAWSWVVDFIRGMPGKALQLVGSAVEFGDKIGNAIKDAILGAVSGLGELLGSAIRGALNYVIDAWNRIDIGIHVSIPDWVPGVGGRGFNIDDLFPDIRRLATGGITTSEGLAYLHANEAVVPLDRYTMAPVYNINVAVAPGTNPAEVGRATVDAIKAYERRNGTSWRNGAN